MVKLPPSEFTFGKYNRNTIPNGVYMARETKEAVEWLNSLNIIGYIEGMELEIRPRTYSYGVMVEDEDYFVSWALVPNDIFDEYLKGI